MNSYTMSRRIAFEPNYGSTGTKLGTLDDEGLHRQYSTQQNMISTEAIHDNEDISLQSYELSRFNSNGVPTNYNSKDRRESLNHFFASSFKIMKSKSIQNRK